MKIIGVIPARYDSTRFPGKPIANICGKPMIWWVYNRVIRSKKLSEVYILTDDKRIAAVCDNLKMRYILTAKNHPNHISRVHEASRHKDADCYVCVNGDEPLIEPSVIDMVVPNAIQTNPIFYGAERSLTEAAKVIDPANIKLVLGQNGKCYYMSRTPIPFPKGTLDFVYHKYVGIECFNKATLDTFVKFPMGTLEKIEDIDHLRFIENGIPLYFTHVESESLSVDTPKDLEYVRRIIAEKIGKGEIVCD